MIEQRSYDWAFDMGAEARRVFGFSPHSVQLNPFATRNEWWKAWRDGFYQLARRMVA